MKMFEAMSKGAVVRRPIKKHEMPVDTALVHHLIRLGQRRHPDIGERQELLIDDEDMNADNWEIVEPTGKRNGL